MPDTSQLPEWAAPADLATTVEFSRYIQAHLSTRPSSERRCRCSLCLPTVVEVVEFVGALVRQFQEQYRHAAWGDKVEWMDVTEQFFHDAPKPDWW